MDDYPVYAACNNMHSVGKPENTTEVAVDSHLASGLRQFDS